MFIGFIYDGATCSVNLRDKHHAKSISSATDHMLPWQQNCQNRRQNLRETSISLLCSSHCFANRPAIHRIVFYLMMADENGEYSNDLSRLVEKVVANDVVGLQELMKSYNLKTDSEDSSGMTLLQHAAFKGKLDICQFLLDLVKKMQVVTISKICNHVNL